MTEIRVGHSPDPDDAFMFFALAKGHLDTGELRFRDVLADIETLNRWAFEGRLEVTAVSLHAYAYVADRYALLTCGASLGHGYGPILVARPGLSLQQALAGPVAIPGRYTTAFLAARLFAGDFPAVEVPFDRILDEVVQGRAASGLLIHEGQLTYAERGLEKLVDLGAWWADETGGLPLPLGVDVVRRDLGPALCARVAALLEKSIAYALDHRPEALEYAMAFGRGLDRPRADRFVEMYVNASTLDLGPRGRQAVEEFLERAWKAGYLPRRVPVDYVSGAAA
ncbi:MAG TPA: MqnA/MqnD/SBP family protein [Candidatus Nitrosotenuis sp.]|jgi:1,4-dihydroxy-6-naphthoate synthase|nr:MqnA/MqnD/SBP family protein [Candidatus Nitrosotenuis sp.]